MAATCLRQTELPGATTERQRPPEPGRAGLVAMGRQRNELLRHTLAAALPSSRSPSRRKFHLSVTLTSMGTPQLN
eukprot:scaffold368814_cov27-Prasinocladus_malaysianus.AAC.3